MESTRYGSSWDGQCWIDRETLRWCGAKLGEIWASWSSEGLLFSGASDSVGVCGEGVLARLKLYTTLEQNVLSDPETSISPKGRKIGFPRSSLSVCQPPPGECNSQYLQKTYSPWDLICSMNMHQRVPRAGVLLCEGCWCCTCGCKSCLFVLSSQFSWLRPQRWRGEGTFDSLFFLDFHIAQGFSNPWNIFTAAWSQEERWCDFPNPHH